MDKLREDWRGAIWLRCLLGGLIAWCVTMQGQEVQLKWGDNAQLSLRVAADASEWFRLEHTIDFSEWHPTRDSIAQQTEITIDPSRSIARYYRLIPVDRPEAPFTIGVVGDSTAVGIQTVPLVGGWAQGLSRFAREETRFVMAGVPGLSSKSFFGSFREHMLTTTTPTVVMIQLGQVDEFNSQPEIKSTTLVEYQENLSAMVDFVREWGGVPMLVTPLPSREFVSEGVLKPYLVERSVAMRELAAEIGVYVIDLHRLVSELYVNGSQEELKSWGFGDDYHLSIPGSVAVAELVLAALPPHIGDLMFESSSEP